MISTADFLKRIFNNGLSNSGIILDTKPLILYVIGSLNPNRVESFVSTNDFTVGEFMELSNFLSCFKNIYITPYVIAEFSHHTIEQKGLREFEKKQVINFVRKLKGNNTFIELFPGLETVFNNKKIIVVGSTDASLMSLDLHQSIPILTSDGTFADEAIRLGKHAIKFIPTIGFANY